MSYMYAYIIRSDHPDVRTAIRKERRDVGQSTAAKVREAFASHLCVPAAGPLGIQRQRDGLNEMHHMRECGPSLWEKPLLPQSRASFCSFLMSFSVFLIVPLSVFSRFSIFSSKTTSLVEAQVAANYAFQLCLGMAARVSVKPDNRLLLLFPLPWDDHVCQSWVADLEQLLLLVISSCEQLHTR